MILDSLVNHIPRALAEYSLLLDSRRTERLAGLRTQTFLGFCGQPPKCAENNRKSFYWRLKSKTSEEISGSGYNLPFNQLNC